jgi:uncharacterized membrane protein (TIGR02234 family)
MSASRVKSISLVSVVLSSAVILLSWSQPWFVFETALGNAQAPSLEISGQVAAPALSAFGLTGFAITAALALSSSLLRRILGILFSIIGIWSIFLSLSALADPVGASVQTLTDLSGISTLDALRELVLTQHQTWWPTVAILSSACAVVSGIFVAASAHKWPQSTKKFERSTAAGSRTAVSDTPEVPDETSSNNVDIWDSLSNGTDPTIN